MKEKWLEDNYSSRIWKDKGRLLTSIETELLSGIAQGHNPKKIAEAMAEKYSQNYKNCERVARTETIHTMNVATSNAYKAHGIEKYEFVCDLSERTCVKCGALDGTVHDLKYKQEGVNYPVMHPNCYDEQTEVLTKDGWKLFKDCTIDDEYFSLNPEKPSETAYLKAVKRISDKSFDLYHFYGNNIDLCVTENHKMVVLYKSPKKNTIMFLSAKDLGDLYSTEISDNFYFLDNDKKEISVSDCEIEIFSPRLFDESPVYCVELEKWHTLLVRRNGSTPVWSGNCRCTTIPYFEKDEIDELFDEDIRISYDENRKRYEVPASMTYREWKEGTAKLSKWQAQPSGINAKSENANNKDMQDKINYSEAAKKMFPNEQWNEISKNLFTASGRLPKNSDEKKKLEKEIAQAQILTANNHVVYLVPEPSDSGKKFDSFVDNRKTELKRVTGNIKAVGRNYREALQQGKDVFLSIQSADLHEVYKKIVSETKDHIKNAMKNNIEIDFSDRYIYVAIDSIKKLHKWSLKNIELQVKKMLQ